MNKHTKKLIAPIIITFIVVIYFMSLVWMLLVSNEFSTIPRIGFALFIGGLAVLAIFMLIERIQEIKGGEEDDISKY